MEILKDRKYTADHEWIVIEGDEATIGITEYAAEQLGEVVYVDLPSEGDIFEIGETFGEVESVKSVSELFMPIGGEVIAYNDALEDAPETVNDDPYESGWMIRISITNEEDLEELLSADEYAATLES